MTALGGVIAGRLAEWGGLDLPVEREVFGTAEPNALAAAVDTWCRTHLGAGIERYEFFESSIGSVHGVVLADGRPVVIKGHRAMVSRAYLDAIMSVQGALAATAYPAPRPLAGPAPMGAGHVTAEEMLRCDARVDGHDARVRRVLAEGLARFIALARPHVHALASAGHPMDLAEGELYPPPHSLRFDFAATSAGAQWIDELAARARAQQRTIAGVPRAVVHGDWRIENLGLRAGTLIAVYDWDSVHVAREPEALATAATTFCVDWQRPPGNRFPQPREIEAFIGEYESARGAAFSVSEHDLLAAAMVASLAYGARCEHADPADTLPIDDSQRGLLRELGAALLDDGLSALGT